MAHRVRITVGCPPGFPRPWDLVDEKIWERDGGCLFGNQAFVSREIFDDREKAEALESEIGAKITAWYNAGSARYGEWDVEEV